MLPEEDPATRSRGGKSASSRSSELGVLPCPVSPCAPVRASSQVTKSLSRFHPAGSSPRRTELVEGEHDEVGEAALDVKRDAQALGRSTIKLGKAAARAWGRGTGTLTTHLPV